MGQVRIVKASAGSGKTYRLAYEYVKKVIKDPDLYRNILAVTFTNKATGEMKRRIVGEIHDLAEGRKPSGKAPAYLGELMRDTGFSEPQIRKRARRVRTKILHDYSHFTILTIDKFFQRIIRAFIRELGMEADFTLELQTDSLLGVAVDRLIEETVQDEELRRWLVEFAEERIAEGKGWDMRGEITNLGKLLFSEDYRAPEDPSVTREKIRSLIGEHTAALEKIKASMVGLAKEATGIIEGNGLSAADFSYGKNGFAPYFYAVASGEVWKGYGKRVGDALNLPDEKWAAKGCARKSELLAAAPRLRELLARICRLYDENRRYANTVALMRANFRTFAILSDLSRQVRLLCRGRNVMLISDTNRIINDLVSGNDTPFIFEKTGNHFSHYMIDEFQDTSRSQWTNFVPLLDNALSQSEQDPVLIVGDVKQSIYRWRGGDWRILGSRVEREFPCVEETLNTNWRSRANIIRFNNEMISAAVRENNRWLNDRLEEASLSGAISPEKKNELTDTLAEAYADCRQSPAREGSDQQGFIRFTQYPKAAETGKYPHAVPILRTIGELQERGFRAGEIAALVRTNKEAEEVARILLEHKGANPDSPYCFDMVTQEALRIGKSPVVLFLTACLRLSVGLDDPVSRAYYLKYLGRPVGDPLTDEEREFFFSLRLVSPEEAFEKLLARYAPGRDTGAIAYIQALHDQMISFSASRISDIPLFLRWWDETGWKESVSLPDGRNAITIITIHKSKGLEYPAVIMPFADWDMMPHRSTRLWADTEEEPFAGLEPMPVGFGKAVADSAFSPHYYEELVYSHVDNVNTLYVALTRAGEELHVMMPEVKKTDGTKVSDLMLRSFAFGEDRVYIGDMEGRIEEGEDSVCYEFGQPVRKEPSSDHNHGDALPVRGYPSFPFEGKIKLRTPGDRFFSDGEKEMSPRRYGQLMHRVFETIGRIDEIPEVLRRLETDGVISSADGERIGELIRNAFRNATVRSWFDGQWDTVRNESNILVPGHASSTRRPDRVMIREGHVTVVDYKFGSQEKKHYARQVEEYLRLALEMGYKTAVGYLWYVELDRVEKVEIKDDLNDGRQQTLAF